MVTVDVVDPLTTRTALPTSKYKLTVWFGKMSISGGTLPLKWGVVFHSYAAMLENISGVISFKMAVDWENHLSRGNVSLPVCKFG
jgi:hypothetical protein